MIITTLRVEINFNVFYLFIEIVYNKHLEHLLFYWKFAVSLIKIFHIGPPFISWKTPGSYLPLSFWLWCFQILFLLSPSPSAFTWLAPSYPLHSSIDVPSLIRTSLSFISMCSSWLSTKSVSWATVQVSFIYFFLFLKIFNWASLSLPCTYVIQWSVRDAKAVILCSQSLGWKDCRFPIKVLATLWCCL